MARKPRPSKQGVLKPRSLTPLSPEEIGRRQTRALPAIARAQQATDSTPASPDTPGAPSADGRGGDLAAVLTLRTADNAGTVGGDALMTWNRHPSPASEPRQMTIWEDREGDVDADVVAGWVAAATRKPPEPDADSTDAAADADAEDAAAFRIWGTRHRIDPAERRQTLMRLTTRDDQHLIQRVRPAVVNLIVEHPFVSQEADSRLTALGIRFGVWSLPRTSDGAFDPYRDLTEHRISAFVRDAGRHLSTGSRASYASALRRLAAGPASTDRGARRTAVEPHSQVVEDGLWTAADAFHPSTWRHGEAKTLLAATFGAGAIPAEINNLAPEDVLVDDTGASLRVSLRLTRVRTWETRDVPVIEPRYAKWLADRAQQFAGQTHLFKPEVVKRRNAINSTRRALAAANAAFERYDLPAARNTWAARWLSIGIPFEVWAKAAGIAPGTHLPTDLLAFLPTPTPGDIDTAFRRAALRMAPQP